MLSDDIIEGQVDAGRQFAPVLFVGDYFVVVVIVRCVFLVLGEVVPVVFHAFPLRSWLRRVERVV
jgi:hypothetical protein